MNDAASASDPPTGRWLALVLSLLLVGTVVGTTWCVEGTLAAQRIILSLVMPVGLAWSFSFFCAWRFWRAGNRRSGLLSAGLFLAISVLFSPLVNRALVAWIEFPPLAVSPLDAKAPVYRAIVVLGGGASLGVDGQPQLNTDGHRIAMAAQMWHAGKVQAILCTGEDDYVPGEAIGSQTGDDQRDRWNPARQGIDLLESLGVPRDRLFRVRGTNTATEMQELKQFFEHPPESFPTTGDLGLITSAFHLPRALRLAKRTKLSFVPIPVSYRTGPAEPFAVGQLVPDAGSGGQFCLVAKECLARLVGR